MVIYKTRDQRYGSGTGIPEDLCLRHKLSSSSFLSSISVLTMRLLQDSSRPLCLRHKLYLRLNPLQTFCLPVILLFRF